VLDFFRFPHTPHLIWLGSTLLRGDKILTASEIDQLLATAVVVEEKIDGANIGLSLDEQGILRVQSRGDYLREPYSGQFKHLSGWLDSHHAIMNFLSPDLVIFGEWCAAIHSLQYSRLPDYFLLFDVYDKKAARFWSSERRNEWAERAGVHTVPRVAFGTYSVPSLLALMREAKSHYSDGPAEGIVVRRDDDRWNLIRGKLVQEDFAQAINEHWRRAPLRWNSLQLQYAMETETLDQVCDDVF
jgi:ATP-dependent RNA circularization protein (DNA/RNA ligase family)